MTSGLASREHPAPPLRWTRQRYDQGIARQNDPGSRGAHATTVLRPRRRRGTIRRCAPWSGPALAHDRALLLVQKAPIGLRKVAEVEPALAPRDGAGSARQSASRSSHWLSGQALVWSAVKSAQIIAQSSGTLGEAIDRGVVRRRRRLQRATSEIGHPIGASGMRPRQRSAAPPPPCAVDR